MNLFYSMFLSSFHLHHNTYDNNNKKNSFIHWPNQNQFSIELTHSLWRFKNETKNKFKSKVWQFAVTLNKRFSIEYFFPHQFEWAFIRYQLIDTWCHFSCIRLKIIKIFYVHWELHLCVFVCFSFIFHFHRFLFNSFSCIFPILLCFQLFHQNSMFFFLLLKMHVKNNFSFKWCINYVIFINQIYDDKKNETSFEYLYTYVPLLVRLVLELYTDTHILIVLIGIIDTRATTKGRR